MSFFRGGSSDFGLLFFGDSQLSGDKSGRSP
jgi:hypothetical protein